ncbi:MAG: hypothetical protein QME51_09990 [Planctomycetota bacterium]|nr:hypothetical protein [Planctomycetota bacterium]
MPEENSQLDADASDVTDSMVFTEEESAAVSVSEEEPSSAPPVQPAIPATFAPPSPKSNIFTLFLILSLICIIVAIYLIAHELNKFYEVTFGGILSPPIKIVETTGSGK